VLLRKTIELAHQRAAKKAEEEQEARDKRTRARILEAVYQVRLASAETEKELFFAAFGIQGNDENGQNDR